jgi:hypothetical protein
MTGLRAMRSGVTLGLIAATGVTFWLLIRMGGLQYYLTPLPVRGYHGLHRAFRPSGPIGQTLGLAGGVMMLVPFLYMLRKRLAHWTWAGSMKTWLEVHLFCGILGPVLVTFHTSFKFNGLISAAYWSMVTVVLSGFVGRYLYVRIPRTVRGTEIAKADLDAKAAALLAELSDTRGDGVWLDQIRALARMPERPTMAGLLFGEIGLHLRLRSLARALKSAELSDVDRARLLQMTTERALIVRRLAYLDKTKTAFGLWHVFHVPLVYFLLVIVLVHIGVTVYLGYLPFRW